MIQSSKCWAIPQALIITLLSTVSVFSQADPPLLETGHAVERDLSGGETHSYRISLAQGQYVRVAVEQRGIDVTVSILAPDGTKRHEMDSPNGLNGPELVSAIAEKAGLYRVDISSPDKKAPRGGYEVKVEELHKATSKDQSRIRAEKDFSEAVQLHLVVRTAPAIREALEKYGSSLEVWREAGEHRMEAMTILQISLVQSRLNQARPAIDSLIQALSVFRTLGDRRTEAILLREVGRKYKQLNEREKAVEFLDLALARWREIGDRYEEAVELCDMGHLYFWFGDPQKGLEYLNSALPLSRSIGSRLVEAATLMNLGLTEWALGDYEKALDYYDRAMPLYRAMGDRVNQAELLTNMALAYSYLSEDQKSLEAYGRALELWRALNHGAGQARTLQDIGGIYSKRGEYERAKEQFEQSIRLGDIVPLGYRSAALTRIGWAYAMMGDKQKAIDYYNQALTLDPNGIGLTRPEALRGLGEIYFSAGEYQKALDYFNQILSLTGMTNRILEPSGHVAIAKTHHRLGDRQKAMEHYSQALQLWRQARAKEREAEVLTAMARLEREQGNVGEARAKAETALKIHEEMRITRTDEQSRAFFFSQAVDDYAFYIDLLMDLHRTSPTAGYDWIALEASERTRARALLDLLGEDRGRIHEGIDSQLLEREKDLRRRLVLKAALQEKSIGGVSSQRVAALSRELEEMLTQYRDLQATIRAKSPRYAALIQPQPLSGTEVQKLLDPDTVLLEYFLGKDRSFVWAVTATSLSFHELPGQAKITAGARRLYDIITARNRRTPDETASAEQARIAQSRAEYSETANELSQMLLGPVAAQLGNRRLLIVADGALRYIPFAALAAPPIAAVNTSTTPTETMTAGQRTARPLIADHEIVNLPSASTLSALRRDAAARQMAPKTVAVIADPVFSADDVRLSSRSTRQAGDVAGRLTSEPLQASLRDTGIAGGASKLPRLMNTRREALAILDLAQAGSRKRALDFDASRATASSPELGQYRIVHFATHGLVNDVHPELSGLVLSLVDETGQPQDGFLRLIDVYNLSLPAELVVLSACRTGLGKEVRGEGLMGLTRGFMYAGSSRVAASLWKVDDRATAELMKRFYEGMLVGRLSPAAALRAAQLGMLKQRQWQDPYYWAAFVLYGEWK